MNARPLDLLQMPLTGVGLVEASAGTGKTFSIAWLYLRLLFEHTWTVEQVLVVTFTEAAATELRDRLRQRLLWARDELAALCEGKTPAGDRDVEQLQALVARCESKGRTRSMLEEAAALALDNFDQAAIFTIHGWCGRVLADYALETQTLFARVEILDDRKIKRRIVDDVWRRELHAGKASAAWLLRAFPSPKKLFEALENLFSLPESAFDPADPAAELVPLYQQRWSALEAFRSLYNEATHAQLLALFANPRFGISTNEEKGYKPAYLTALFAALHSWIDAGLDDAPLPDYLARLHPNKFSNSQVPTAVSAGKPLPEHPLLSVLLTLAEIEAQIGRLQRGKVLRDSLAGVGAELRRQQEASGVMGYDALIERVHESIIDPRFARQLHTRYPVALVDEFQDTDQRQFDIFSALYVPAGTLLMIGDVKQSIYRFRGGDIFAYLAAREAAHNAVGTLTTNYRSEPGLTKAVNLLFGNEGSFIYDFIHWNEVRSGGPKNGSNLLPNPSPLVIWQAKTKKDRLDDASADTDIGGGEFSKRIAVAVASEIVLMLNAGVKSELSLAGRGVCANDIAILVNTHQQAALMERHLRASGVPASRLSRESVYATAQARELLLVLRALLQPNDAMRLRAALSTELYGWDAARIAALETETDLLYRMQQSVFTFATVWREHGPSALMNDMLSELASNLLLYLDGERRVIHFRHLAELLDVAHANGFSLEEQVIELTRGIANPDGESETEQVRAESDGDAVRIITIHASKGLEYPIVFAPFLWQPARKVRSEAPVLSHDPGGFELVADLGSPQLDSRALLAEKEEYAEAVRRAYVACTRAVNRLYLVWGNVKDAERSPLASLLRKALGPDNVSVTDGLNELMQRGSGAVAVRDMPPLLNQHWQKPLPQLSLSAREFTGDLDDPRSVYSFTRITHGAPGADAEHRVWTLPLQGDAIEELSAESMLRGAVLGQCVHAILQDIDFQSPDGAAANALIERCVQRYGFSGIAAAAITRWTKAALSAELTPGLRLCGVLPRNRVAEMEFYFSLKSGSARRLADLAQDFPAYADALDLLAQMPRGLQGWMHGYIDLVVQHGERFFVIDYKSNYLGPDAASYGAEKLAEVIAANHYDLQALLYLVALHRYLKGRLGADYDPEAALGGALYLFVRGMDGDSPGSGVYFLQPPKKFILQLDNCFANGYPLQ